MRSQPPDNNNPANPLFKVAALELDKDYIGAGSEQKVKIKASLTFKKSNDLNGKAKTKDGKRVNVSFGLVIKRASLQLVCKDDNGKSPDDFVKIEKVAFAASLAQQQRIQDDELIRRKSETALNAGGELKGTASLLESGAGAVIKAGAGARLTTSRVKNHSVRRRYKTTNVSATHAGNEVHWEIEPNISRVDDALGPHLQGNVFVSVSGKSMDACTITRKDGRAAANLEILASVFVSMKDLAIENIEFIDDDGVDVHPKNILSDGVESSSLPDLFAFKKLAREKVLKQIIRKHLITQGLKVEGALVEICRAFT